MATTINLKNILSKIESNRKAKGLSIENLADELNISTAAYHKIEKGKTRIHLTRFLKICSILELDPAKLIKADKDELIQQKQTFNDFASRYRELYHQNLQLSKKLIETLEKRIVEIEKR